MKKTFAIIGILMLASCSGSNSSIPSITSYTLTNAGNGLYVLSEQWGIVTRIDMTTFSLTTYNVGNGADMILGAGNNVVVLNPVQNAIYVIGNNFVKKSIDINLNDMIISPDNTHAVVYHNYIPGEEAEFNGILVFNTFSVVNLTTTTDDTISLSIGGGAPQQVVFTPSGDRFVVISRNRCFIVNTSNPSNNNYIELWPNPSRVIIPDQVVITPQGDIALIRTQQENAVYIINLLQSSIMNVFSENQPTQIALYQDGNKGLIVDAGSNSVSVLTFSHNPVAVSEQTVGLLTPASAVATSFSCTGACSLSTATYSALFYSPSSSSTNISYLRIKNDVISTTVFGDLIAPVQFIMFAPDEPEKALILHGASYLSNAAYPMSVVNVDNQEVNYFYVKTVPSSLIFAKNQAGDELVFMTLTSQNELVYYDLSSGTTNYIKLPPLPDALGVSGNTLFVSHDQPLGFISLLDINSFRLRFISGFNAYKLFDR
ncbi:MAG: hypothetical protein ACP5JP_09070 [bacterium]